MKNYTKWTEENEQAFQAMYGALYERDAIGDFVPKRWASSADYVGDNRIPPNYTFLGMATTVPPSNDHTSDLIRRLDDTMHELEEAYTAIRALSRMLAAGNKP